MRSITIKTQGFERTFEGDPQLHRMFMGAYSYFASVPDPSSPSGRRTAWQQRIENERTEAVQITVRGFDYNPFQG
jgi:hypothetical protein